MAISLTRFRRNLGACIEEVRTGGGPMIVNSHGKNVAALVSMEDLHLIWSTEDEVRNGPVDLETGRRVGYFNFREVRAWMGRRFGGRFLHKVEEVQLESGSHSREAMFAVKALEVDADARRYPGSGYGK